MKVILYLSIIIGCYLLGNIFYTNTCNKLKLIYETKVNKQKLCLWEGYLGPIQTKKLKTKILESDEYYFNHNLIIYNISSSPQTFFCFMI